MLKSRLKTGIAAILLVLVASLISGTLEFGNSDLDELSPIRRVSVNFELGSKEITIDDYIAGVLCSFGKWLDLDRENTEMVKLLSVLVRTNVISAMGQEYTIEADKLPFSYVGKDFLVINYGADADSQWNYIMDCVKITDTQVLSKDGNISVCPWYEANEQLKDENDSGVSLPAAREMTREGKDYKEVLKYFFKDLEITSIDA